MRLFGKTDRSSEPVQLVEVAFDSAPENLRQLARFLTRAADLIEAHGMDFGHEHMRDQDGDWPEHFPDIIVVRSQA